MNQSAEIRIRPIPAEATYALRHSVLWPDKAPDYVRIPEDAQGHHFGAFENEELVSVISLFVENGVARFRKFATRPDRQGNGIGSRLLKHVFAEARRLGARQIWCDARLSAAAFYQRFAMEPTGERFYKGEIPYQRFEAPL